MVAVYTGLAVGVEASTEGNGSWRSVRALGRGDRSLRTSSATMTWPSSTVGGGRRFACRKRIAAAPIRMPAVNTHPTVKPAPSTIGPSEVLDDDDEPVASCSSSSSAAFFAFLGV